MAVQPRGMAKAAFVKGALRFRCALAHSTRYATRRSLRAGSSAERKALFSFGYQDLCSLDYARDRLWGYRYSAPSEVVCGHVRACAIATPPLRKILGLVIAVVAGGWVSGKNG